MSQSELYKDVDYQINHLYGVVLEYYTVLKEKNHEKIKLITDVLDELIKIKKMEEKTDEEYKKLFIDVNSMAFNNINAVYDHDKKMEELEKEKNKEEENKIEIIE